MSSLTRMSLTQLAAVTVMLFLCITIPLAVVVHSNNFNPGLPHPGLPHPGLLHTTNNDHTTAVSSDLPSGSDGSSSRCAILFFGLPRRLKDIGYGAIKEYILDANPHCDVFAHTYDVTKVVGSRAGEDGEGHVDISDIFLLFGGQGGSDSDSHANNDDMNIEGHLTMETDEIFRSRRDLKRYENLIPQPSSWNEDAMDNMIRQWHSIDQVWSLMERSEGSGLPEEPHEHGKRWQYDRVGLFRVDVLYTHPIVITNPTELAVVPKMMYNPTRWGGINDRMFYGTREFASIWATKRFPSVDSYLDYQTRNPEYNSKRGLHSEDFLKFLLTKSEVPLTIKPICFMRIRSTGRIMHDDCRILYGHVDKAETISGGTTNESRMDLMEQSDLNSIRLGDNVKHQQSKPKRDDTSSKEKMQKLLVGEHRRRNQLASHRICITVRTHPGQANLLPITLLSLTQQSYLQNMENDDVALSIYVVNTDPIDYAESTFMHDAANDANQRIGHAAITVLGRTFHIAQPSPVKKVYGYDVTDRVLDMLLAENPQNEDYPKCTHFLFTNGDNFYTEAFLEYIIPAIKKGKQLIAWDYLTHHKRKRNVISVEIKRGFVDLGSALVTREAIKGHTGREEHVRFLPKGFETPDKFARDYFFFKEVYDKVGVKDTEMIHQVLFAHQ